MGYNRTYDQDVYRSDYFGVADPTNQNGNIGFRVAAVVPEPSSFVVAAVGMTAVLFAVRRRRAR